MDLLASLAAKGFLVNNLYQLDDGSWRASLRKPVEGGDVFTGWAEAPTLTEVLEEAIASIEFAEFKAERATNIYLGEDLSPKRLDLKSLIRTVVPQSKLRFRTLR